MTDYSLTFVHIAQFLYALTLVDFFDERFEKARSFPALCFPD
jgi:hypothetical protein